MAEWLAEKRGRGVSILVPKRGETLAILGIAGRNAESTFRTVPGADDYAMMYEVLKRRYAKRENLPDLIMVDGGKGQLGVALAILKDLAVKGVDVIGLAKERDDARLDVPNGAPGKGEDRVYLPGRKDPVTLSRWPAALFLLQRVRDEAHRFAVSYHRKVKEKEDLRSLLDRIPGIGPARRKALLVFLGDVRRIRAASVEELQQVEGIGPETARRIREFLDVGQPPAPVAERT
jgi:excinuclease ABC subunit C